MLTPLELSAAGSLKSALIPKHLKDSVGSGNEASAASGGPSTPESEFVGVNPDSPNHPSSSTTSRQPSNEIV